MPRLSPQSVACPVTHTHTPSQIHQLEYEEKNCTKAHQFVGTSFCKCPSSFVNVELNWFKDEAHIRHPSPFNRSRIEWTRHKSVCPSKFPKSTSNNGVYHIFRAKSCCLVEMTAYFIVFRPIQILSGIFARWARQGALFEAPHWPWCNGCGMEEGSRK